MTYFIVFLGSATFANSRARFWSVFAIKFERLRLSLSAILSICSTNVCGKLIDICVIPIVFPDPFLRAILLFPFLLVR